MSETQVDESSMSLPLQRLWSSSYAPVGWVVLGPEHLAHFRLALPTGPVFPVKFHEFHGGIDHLLLRLDLKDCIASDDLSGLSERAIDHRNFSFSEPNAVTYGGWR